MGFQHLLGPLVVTAAVVCAAEWQVTVTPGRAAETQITLSKDDMAAKPSVWIQADPNRIEVSVTGPGGQRYSGASRDQRSPVVIQLADGKSSSEDERRLAEYLGGDATLVTWNGNAAVGTYTIHLAAHGLSSPIPVTLRRETAEVLTKEMEAKAKHREKELEASLYAAPERRAPLDAQGNATLIMTGTWEKDDVILVGTAFKGEWSAMVQLPDGVLVTKANAEQSRCGWRPAGGGWMPPLIALKPGGSQLSISCPDHMGSGPIAVTMHADSGNDAAAMVAAVFRTSAFEAILKQASEQMAEAHQTIALRHQPETWEQRDYVDTVVGRPVAVRLALSGGTSPVKNVAVTGIAYLRVQTTSVLIFGPDPSKRQTGTIAPIVRGRDGNFVYTFTGSEEGIHQLDFKADGVFENGRRFSANASVTVFVKHKGATVTQVRQQRVDRRDAGKPDIVRFLIDLDVTEPGRYEVFIQVGAEPNQSGFAAAERMLAVGKQTIVVDGNAELLAQAKARPDDRLRVNITNRNPLKDGAFPSEVVMEVTMPKAGEFEKSLAASSGMTGAGATWRFAGTELAVSVPVVVSGVGCRWSATLEVSPARTYPNQVIRTVGYRQSGVFTTRDGKANIESRWNLSPFFKGGPPFSSQGFVYRLQDARCGENRAFLENPQPGRESDDGIYAMPFTAELSGFGFGPFQDRGGAETPRVAGLAVVEPIDKDGDGKFDHLKASFDLVSPGGTCIWSGMVIVGEHGSVRGGRAETTPGVNHVSMEMDAPAELSLGDEPVFHFSIGRMKCGVNPVFRPDEIEAELMRRTVYLDQQFAIDSRRFAGQER